jgi:hypothetical protein
VAYARTDYTLADIRLAFREIDTNLTKGAQLDPTTGTYRLGSPYGKGNFGLQPTPHAGIHGADELHNHPLFAKARVTTGEVNTHSTMSEAQMMTALVGVMNHAGMQPFLAQLDGGADSVNVNVNFTNSPGTCNVFKMTKAGATSNLNQAVWALVLKIRKNPGNANVPIIQTSIPHTAFQTLATKKGAVLGFKI